MPFAHAAGDAVAEQLIFGQFLWILQILQHIHLAVLTGLDGIVVNEVGFETANLFKHRIEVGNKIALDREAGKCSEFDGTQMIPFVDLMGEVLLECVDVVCVVDIAGTAESLVVGVGDVG